MQSININGDLLSLDSPLIMGILNLTRDSFYDGGKYVELNAAVDQAINMLDAGADIIDIGAFSSRPGAPLVPATQQLALLVPVVEQLLASNSEIRLSIDTYSAEVVDKLAQLTGFIVNDISGYSYDDKLLATVAKHKLPYILMHIQGTPETMASKASYDDVVFTVLTYLANKLHEIKGEGIRDILIDPGFGFAKTRQQNFKLLSNLAVFQVLEHPVLVGLSRKSMIYKTLETTAAEALNGTTALHMAALLNGARILRVHDVKEASETRKLWAQLHSPVND